MDLLSIHPAALHSTFFFKAFFKNINFSFYILLLSFSNQIIKMSKAKWQNVNRFGFMLLTANVRLGILSPPRPSEQSIEIFLDFLDFLDLKI